MAQSDANSVSVRISPVVFVFVECLISGWWFLHVFARAISIIGHMDQMGGIRKIKQKTCCLRLKPTRRFWNSTKKRFDTLNAAIVPLFVQLDPTKALARFCF